MLRMYDLLVEKGFEKSRVREALHDVVTTKEMEIRLKSLEERIDHRLTKHESKLYRALLLQTLTILSVTIGLMALA